MEEVYIFSSTFCVINICVYFSIMKSTEEEDSVTWHMSNIMKAWVHSNQNYVTPMLSRLKRNICLYPVLPLIIVCFRESCDFESTLQSALKLRQVSNREQYSGEIILAIDRVLVLCDLLSFVTWIFYFDRLFYVIFFLFFSYLFSFDRLLIMLCNLSTLLLTDYY